MKKNAAPALRWRGFGPDWAKLKRLFARADDLERLRQRYGEIRVRYAAILLDGMDCLEGNSGPLLERAVEAPWLAPTTVELVARVFSSEGVRFADIPWLQDYLPDATPRQRGLLVELASCSLLGPPVEPFVEVGRAAVPPLVLDEDVQSLNARGATRLQYHLYEDFDGLSVLLWLSFLVDGGKDPWLKRAHDQSPPRYNVRAFSRYEKVLEDVRSQIRTRNAERSRIGEPMPS